MNTSSFMLATLILTVTAFVPSEARSQELSPDQVPRRIIAVAPSTAEIICSLGACDSIVGVSKFCVYPPELKNRVQIGGLYDLDLEAILALRPDLIVTRGHHDALQQLAEQHKIRIFHDPTDSLPDLTRTVSALGDLLGKPARAEALLSKFNAQLESIRKRSERLPKVRVLLTVSRNPQRLANILTAGRHTFLTEMLEIAGGINVFGDLDMRYPEVSVESIIARRPQCIIELMPEIDVAAMEPALRKQWKELSLIPAVQSDCVHFLDTENALIPSLRYVDFIEYLFGILHPGFTE